MKLLDLLMNHVPRDRKMVLRVGAEQWNEWFDEAPPMYRLYSTEESRPNMIFGPTLVVKDETLPPREYKLEPDRYDEIIAATIQQRIAEMEANKARDKALCERYGIVE